MAEPVGEDGWLALVDEASRTASDLEQRVGVVEVCELFAGQILWIIFAILPAVTLPES